MPHDDYVYALAIQSDGKLVAGGYASDSSTIDFALARYNGDGSLDTTFDADGMLTTAFGSGYDYAYALAIQSDSKLVMAGSAHNGSNDDFALARYDGGTGNTAPTISNITDQGTDEDTPTGAISFTVGDGEIAAGSLTVTASSNNQTVAPDANIALGGSGANRTVIITLTA